MGVETEGPGGTAPHFFHKATCFTFFILVCRNRYLKYHFVYVYIPEALKMMLQPTQMSRNLMLSLTVVTRPLHYENRFDASVVQESTKLLAISHWRITGKGIENL